MRFTKALFPILFVFLLGPAFAEETELPETDEASIDEAKLDALRALGYVTASDEPADLSKAGVVRFKPKLAQPGYNYVVYSHCLAELVDMEGDLVHSWKVRKCNRWGKTALLPDGGLVGMGIFTKAATGNQAPRFLARISSTSEVLWREEASVHHTVVPIAGGKLLTFTLRRRQVMDGDGETLLIVDNGIATYGATGKLISEVSLFNTLIKPANAFSVLPVKANDLYFDNASDLFHLNSIQLFQESALSASSPLYKAGNVLICIRNQDTIAILDATKKNLLWSWGRGELEHPHDARLLESGNVLIFDNGAVRGYSRIIEVDPRSNQITWSYQGRKPKRFLSETQGANQRLGNGNTLITESTKGHAFEVTPEGKKVWEFWSPHFTAKENRHSIVMVRRVTKEGVKVLLDKETIEPAS